MTILAKLEDLFESSAFAPGTIPDNLLQECIKFRTDIYVAEGYLPEPEQSAGPDCYDPQSAHICIRARKTGHLAGYCRMIYGSPYPVPMAQLYPDLKESPAFNVEISRFSVRNYWRGNLSAVGMAPIFRLARELLVISHREEIRYWGCLIDDRFQKLCTRFFNMKFHILGKPRIYMGSPSVPCIIDLTESIRNNLHDPDFETFWSKLDLQNWIAELD